MKGIPKQKLKGWGSGAWKILTNNPRGKVHRSASNCAGPSTAKVLQIVCSSLGQTRNGGLTLEKGPQKQVISYKSIGRVTRQNLGPHAKGLTFAVIYIKTPPD